MLDTNSISQAGEVVTAVKAQVTANWPAICAAAVIVARELKNLNGWAVRVAEYIISHGGLGKIVCKLVWNPEPNLKSEISNLKSLTAP